MNVDFIGSAMYPRVSVRKSIRKGSYRQSAMITGNGHTTYANSSFNRLDKLIGGDERPSTRRFLLYWCSGSLAAKGLANALQIRSSNTSGGNGSRDFFGVPLGTGEFPYPTPVGQ